jgi:hypothetical protein
MSINGLDNPDLLQETTCQINTRLSRRLDAWRALLVAHPQREFLLAGIKNGFRLPMFEGAKPFRRANGQSAYVHEEFVDSELDKLKKLGAVREVPPEYALGVMAINVVVQSSGKLRLVVNGTPANEQGPPPEKFAYEDMDFVALHLPPGAWSTKFDVVKLYYHMPLHRKSSRWCCVHWKGRTLAFRVMPMGVSHAPRLATLLLRPAIEALRAAEAHVAQYLDDGLIWAPTQVGCRRSSQLYAHLFYRLGLLLHPEKCETVPAQQIEFLGFWLDASDPVAAPVATLTVRRRRGLIALAKQYQRQAAKGSSVKIRALASFAGSMVFITRAFEPCPALLRPLFDEITRMLEGASWYASAALSTTLAVTFRAIRAMLAADLWTRRPLRPPTTPEIVLTTDASNWGWSGFLSSPTDQETALELPHQARWPAEVATVRVTPTFSSLVAYLHQHLSVPPSQQMTRVAAILDVTFPLSDEILDPEVIHNNVLELLGILFAVLRYAKELEDKALVVRSDNTTALAALRRGVSKSPTLARLGLALRIVLACMRTQIVTAVHLPGDLNSLADEGSRAWFQRHARLEWPADSTVLLNEIAKVGWRFPDLDMFATAANTKCPRFVSLAPDPLAWAVDAFSLNWKGMQFFANPPFAIAARVVRKVLLERPEYCLLLLPDWPRAHWFHPLADWPSIPLPPHLVQTGPEFNLLEPLTNPKWTTRLWKIAFLPP